MVKTNSTIFFPVIIVAIFSFLAVAKADSPNLLQNSSFEAGIPVTPWDETQPPAFWNRNVASGGWANWAQEGELEWSYKPDEFSPPARTGTRYITIGAWDTGFGEFSQTVPGSDNTQYTFQIYGRNGWGYSTSQLGIEYLDQSQSLIASDALIINTGPSWEIIQLVGQQSPEGTEWIRCRIQNETLHSHNHFDDATLTSTHSGNPDVSIAYSAHNRKHRILGMGAQIWSVSPRLLRVLDELDIDYVRTSSQSAADFAINQGCKIIFLCWAAPSWMLDGNNELQTEHLDDYADHWGDTLDSLAAADIYPEYIELSNEPDGTWNMYISPSNYNLLVPLVRGELDDRGHSNTGIVGPGLAHFDWNSHNLTWITALDSNSASLLAGWSTHTWDDGSICHGGASCIESVWPEFGDTADNRNDAIPKFITEYATKENTFHGVTYPHPDQYRDYNASNTIPYATRVYENTLALLNSGAHAPFIWQATDQSWESKGWGLIDLNSTPKPVFFALKTLMPEIQSDSVVLEPVLEDSTVYSGAYLKNRTLVLGLSNDSSSSRTCAIEIQNVVSLTITKAEAFEMDVEGNPETSTPDTGRIVNRNLSVANGNLINVTLPGDSTLTVSCNLQFSPGDSNGDGIINIDDFPELASCLSGPGVQAQETCIELFDFDSDLDVDLKDYCEWLLLND